MKANSRQSQAGFGYIAAIVVLVVLAGLAAGLVRLSTTQHVSSSLDHESARAYQAAGAGIQWGLYRVLSTGAAGCVASQTLSAAAVTGFTVQVTCQAIPFNEGVAPPAGATAQAKTIYTITALACNAAACPPGAPAASGTADYVERRRMATACVAAPGNTAC